MNRKTIITIHMYLAAFFTPAVLLMAVSGGLYLIGIKGQVDEERIYSSQSSIDPTSKSLKTDVDKLLSDAGVSAFNYEYVKVSGNRLYTRPTSSNHYIIESGSDGMDVIYARPSLQKRMIELHKGHGPGYFKTFQQAFAVGLIFIMLSGLWLGVSNQRLRRSTLATAVSGAILFTLLLL